jgi:hypothetical protein
LLHAKKEGIKMPASIEGATKHAFDSDELLHRMKQVRRLQVFGIYAFAKIGATPAA